MKYGGINEFSKVALPLLEFDDQTNRLFFDLGECNLIEYIVHAVANNILFVNEKTEAMEDLVILASNIIDCIN